MEFTKREHQEGSKVERIALGIREELYQIDPNVNVSITRLLDDNKRLKEQQVQQKGGNQSTDDLENIAETVESVFKKYAE